MDKVSEKLMALEELVHGNESKLQTKVTITRVFYTFLVVAVSAYTFFMVWKIKQWTSPEVTSEILIGMISQQTAQARLKATEHLRENSELMASTVLQHSLEAVPRTEETLVGVIDNVIDYAANHIEAGLVPAFSKALRENSADLREHYKGFQDEEKMQGLSLILVEMLEVELDNYINENFVSEIFKLKKQLLALKKPNQELTKKELAQKQVLSNWVFLTDHHDMGNSALLDFINRIKDEFDSILEIEHQERESEVEPIDYSTVQNLSEDQNLDAIIGSKQ